MVQRLRIPKSYRLSQEAIQFIQSLRDRAPDVLPRATYGYTSEADIVEACIQFCMASELELEDLFFVDDD